jgi:hypothetical protein
VEIDPRTYRIGDYVGPIADKDASETREIPCFSRESIPDLSVIQTVTGSFTNRAALQ